MPARIRNETPTVAIDGNDRRSLPTAEDPVVVFVADADRRPRFSVVESDLPDLELFRDKNTAFLLDFWTTGLLDYWISGLRGFYGWHYIPMAKLCLATSLWASERDSPTPTFQDQEQLTLWPAVPGLHIVRTSAGEPRPRDPGMWPKSPDHLRSEAAGCTWLHGRFSLEPRF